VADQFGAQFGVVVDTAVEDDGEPEIGVGHRLGRLLGKVDDAQAPVPEGDASLRMYPASVRPARGERFHHPPDGGRIGECAFGSDFSGNSTHVWSFSLVIGGVRRRGRDGRRTSEHGISRANEFG
jgi:hypothetical protein